MADNTYYNSPTKQELRERRDKRNESRRNFNTVLAALKGLKSADRNGTYEEPEVDLITPVPKDLLKKKPKDKFAKVTSRVEHETKNVDYDRAVKERQKELKAKESKPVVDPARPLKLSWDVTSGKNDNSKVASRWTPALAPPEESENPRVLVSQKREATLAKKVKAPENKLEPFEYKPKVEKISGQPRVAGLVETIGEKKVAHADPQRVASTPFR